MKFFIIFCSVFLILSLALILAPVADAQEIYTGTLRLHVLANSDSDRDQAVKLKVRDRILELMEERLENAEDAEESKEIITAALGEIEKAAAEKLGEYGFDYGVKVDFGEEYYPTREYGDATLPAGNYSSLRVMLGEANGQNWWCVLFPPICTSPAKAEDEFISAGFTPAQIKLVTGDEDPEYRLRFRIVEIFGELFS